MALVLGQFSSLGVNMYTQVADIGKHTAAVGKGKVMLDGNELSRFSWFFAHYF